MDVRGGQHLPVVRTALAGLARLNARHPWSHNDHFHPWLLRRLPEPCRLAVDVGCGQGLLVARLAARAERVVGIDVDPHMREEASLRSRDLTNVTITDACLPNVAAEHGAVDAVTMVAVLHHLEAAEALTQVREALAPGGRFLAVGLAPPVTARDAVWELASAVTNPLIGMVKHPRPSRAAPAPDAFPVADPTRSFGEIRTPLDAVMPGARLQHRLGFRHTIAWTKPR
ncbi:class I SAM-dependent methyltransferase [Propioniciclava soli]|uniref:class I SAM-dependent methyltransferase n=1 Tax=Propioniciclava soli TaxID=2775081 RepID=UPI001E2C2E86|nr:class I SAM-dependent methyltransferase [Propioniciclava soli]